MTMTGQPGTGRRPDGAAFIIAALLAAFGALLLWEASTIPDKGGYAGIGPAAMPKIVGWGLLALAAATGVGAFRGRLAEVPRQNPVPLLLIGGGLVLQIALLQRRRLFDGHRASCSPAPPPPSASATSC